MLDHLGAGLREFWMAGDVGLDFFHRSHQRIGDLFEDLANADRRGPDASLSKALQFLGGWPLCCAVKREGHRILGQINRSGHKIIDRGEPCFALYIVIDDTEVFRSADLPRSFQNSVFAKVGANRASPPTEPNART
jgi:hypothetical protein